MTSERSPGATPTAAATPSPSPAASAATPTVIDPSAPPLSTFAGAINDAGVIVGSYLDARGQFHGFTDRGGVFSTVSDPAGAQGTAPQGISNTGAVVGFYTDSSGTIHGFESNPAR
jgi:hypothetical protein